jgi:hypothetical protein
MKEFEKLAKAAQEIKDLEKEAHLSQENAVRFMDAGKKYGPLALRAYMEALKVKEIDLSLPIWLVIHRSSTGFVPDEHKFWSHPDAVVALYNCLKREGIYAGTKGE